MKLRLLLVFSILYSVFSIQSVSAGCSRCGSAECGQCSVTSAGWRCKCSYILDDGTYGSCAGEWVGTNVCQPPAPPTPPPSCVPNWHEVGRSSCTASCGGGQQTVTEYDDCGHYRSRNEECNKQACAPTCTVFSTWDTGCQGTCETWGQKSIYTLTTCGGPDVRYESCWTGSCPPSPPPAPGPTNTPVLKQYYYLISGCGCVAANKTFATVNDCTTDLRSKPGYGSSSCSANDKCAGIPTPIPTATAVPTPTPCTRTDSYWSAWSACSASCGTGTQTRTCQGSVSCGGSNGCTGPASQSCNTQACIWFQVDGGGVTAKGMIRSQVPSGEVFVKNVPGVAAANKTVDLNGQPLSNAGNWQAQNSNIETIKDYYTEITSRMIFGVTPNTYTGSFNGVPNADGYTYYKATGAIDLAATDFGSGRIVLVVEGDVTIRGNITFGSNGLFILLAKGNITIDPAVSNIQGIYLTQQVLSTGTGNQLKLDGSFIGMTGVQLQRTGGSPSELFVFHPEYLTSLPKYMLRKNVIWEEVAP